jgi:hypothetical protein
MEIEDLFGSKSAFNMTKDIIVPQPERRTPIMTRIKSRSEKNSKVKLKPRALKGFQRHTPKKEQEDSDSSYSETEDEMKLGSGESYSEEEDYQLED